MLLKYCSRGIICIPSHTVCQTICTPVTHVICLISHTVPHSICITSHTVLHTICKTKHIVHHSNSITQTHSHVFLEGRGNHLRGVGEGLHWCPSSNICKYFKFNFTSLDSIKLLWSHVGSAQLLSNGSELL